LFDFADIIVAVDVTESVAEATNSIAGRVNVRHSANYASRDHRSENQSARTRQPCRPKVEHFAVLVFLFLRKPILRAAEVAKEELKLMIGGQMKAHQTE
jgi:hypothetical protein